MQISIENKYGITDVKVIAENVNITETISETLYGRTEDGRIDFARRLGRDITNEAMDKYTEILNEIVYRRDREYDSSHLIENLFDKLPVKIRTDLIIKLANTYDI